MKPAWIFLAGMLAAGCALAADDAGTVKTLRGKVTLQRAGQSLPVAVGDRVKVSDRVITGPDGAVGITLRDNTLLSAGPGSQLSLDKFRFDPTTHAGEIDTRVERGTLSVISGKVAKASSDTVVFRTPTMTLGVRGTEFVIEVPERP